MSEDSLVLEPVGRTYLMRGHIACKGRIVIDVFKYLECVDDPPEPDPLVQTVEYAYNVFVQGEGNLFRYDNQHADHLHAGHQDEHHKHLFNWGVHDEANGSPIWTGAERWPTLGDVIQEACDWHCENYSRLKHPDDFPDLDLCRLW